MIIMQTEQEFHCTVLGLQLRNLCECRNTELIYQLGSEGLREVAHGFEVIDPLHIQPVKDLPAAKSRLSVVLGPLLQLF